MIPSYSVMSPIRLDTMWPPLLQPTYTRSLGLHMPKAGSLSHLILSDLSHEGATSSRCSRLGEGLQRLFLRAAFKGFEVSSVPQKGF